MSEKNDGGPAFPSHEQWNEWSELKAEYVPRTGPKGGMSLRDYFAIRAPEPSAEYINSQGEHDRLANPHGDSYKPKRRSRFEIIADYRYAYADAMLAERERDK